MALGWVLKASFPELLGSVMNRVMVLEHPI